MQNRIAFLHYGSFSHANSSLLEKFSHHFEGLQIDVIDVYALMKQCKHIMALNLYHVCKEYGMDLLLRKRNFKRSFFATTFMFKHLSQLAARHISKEKHLFSFQTQSLFDGSTPDVPHFVYTDHTTLANLQYPDVKDRSSLRVRERGLALERSIYHNATVNFTMSNHIAWSIAHDYDCPSAKIVRAFAGSNVAAPAPSADRRYDQKNILFVGVDWERKGGPQLVEAFKRVRQVHPDASLTVVGCSPQVNVPNCHVVGRVPKEEMARYYADASVFCLPTRREPFGFVFIEAMAHGLPIVATNIAAIPDFVTPGETGYMVKPDDIVGLADALIDLIGDPAKCRSFGANGYCVYQKHYSWDNAMRIIRETISAAIGAPLPNAAKSAPTQARSPVDDSTWKAPRLQISG